MIKTQSCFLLILLQLITEEFLARNNVCDIGLASIGGLLKDLINIILLFSLIQSV